MKKIIIGMLMFTSVNVFAVDLKGIDGIKFGDGISSYQDAQIFGDGYLRKSNLLDFDEMFISTTPITKNIARIAYFKSYDSENACEMKLDAIITTLSNKLHIEFKGSDNIYNKYFMHFDQYGVSIYAGCTRDKLSITIGDGKFNKILKDEEKQQLLEKTNIQDDIFIK